MDSSAKLLTSFRNSRSGTPVLETPFRPSRNAACIGFSLTLATRRVTLRTAGSDEDWQMQLASRFRPAGCDYDVLAPDVADVLRVSAERIRKYGKKTLKDVIEIGMDFLLIEGALTRRFNRWLRAEVAWTRRTATNFMGVAEWLGGKVEIISTLAIRPTAALKLAAPYVPENARQEALNRALAGEKITSAVAEDIIAKICEELGIEMKVRSDARLRGRLAKTLDACEQHWKTKEFRRLKKQLLDHVDLQVTADKNAKGASR